MAVFIFSGYLSFLVERMFWKIFLRVDIFGFQYVGTEEPVIEIQVLTEIPPTQ